MSDDQNTQPNEPDIASLRAAADENPQLRAQAEQATREIAFLRAGVDTTSPLGRMVMAEHAGELTAEAIAATRDSVREQLGIPTAGTSTPGAPGTPEAQLAATAAALAGGGAPATTPPPAERSVEEEALHWMGEARKAGQTRQQAEIVGIGSIVRDAANGKPDAIWNADAFAELAREQGHGAHLAGLPDAPMGSHR